MSPVTVWVVAAELNSTGVWRANPIHGVTTYAVIGVGEASGGCHVTTACALPGVAVPMIGGGSATHAVSPTDPTPIANTIHKTGQRLAPARRRGQQASKTPGNR